MRVLVSGSTGLIGTAVTQALTARGDTVVRLVRRGARGDGEVAWDPAGGTIDAAGLAGIEGVVHLAGENLSAGRWTAARKREIRDSRVNGTRLLAETLARLAPRPRVLVSGSAMGFYGDRGDETLTEASEPGTGFLPATCQEWEAAANPARAAGIRVVHPRLGLVLAREGGVLERLIPVFRLGAGGPIGDGRAWWSWVDLDDVVQVILAALDRDDLAGPVDVAAPNPVRNAEFARALGRALGRPAWLPVPPLALKILFGEMADQVLLSSARMVPARLEALGYRFRWPDLAGALAHRLGRGPR